MDKLAETTGMSSNIKLGLAHSCLTNRMDEQATKLFEELTADPASGIDESTVLALCQQAGREDMGKTYAGRLEAEVDAMVRKAAAKSGDGDLRGAVEILQSALLRAPDHTGLWSAAATAMLREIGEHGWDALLATQCTGLLRRMRENTPDHPLLPGLVAQYAAIRQKYSAAIAATAPTTPPPQAVPAAAESR
jgi:hypothetical protein